MTYVFKLIATFTTLLALSWGSLYSNSIRIPANLFSSDCAEIFSKDKSDYPLPTERTFIDFCDHQVICSRTYIDPDAVKLGDTVFVMDWALSWFLKSVHPFIKYPYILVSGDTPADQPGPEAKIILYDPKIAAWFTKNLILSNHPKLIAIPVGQSIYQSSLDEDHRQYYLNLSANKSYSDKLEFPLLYANFNLVNHSLRKNLYEFFLNSPFCVVDGILLKDMNLSKKEYWQQLTRFKFALAPRGQGIDTTRFWEAVGLKTIPIVEHSPLDALYAGTPSILILDWEDVTEEFLDLTYAETLSKIEQGILSDEKGFFPYWSEKITSVKELIKQGSCSSDLNLTKFDIESLNTIKQILLDNTLDRTSSILLVYGKCLALRAFQLANCMPEFQRIFIADEYAFDNNVHAKILNSLADDDSLFINNHSDKRSEIFTSEAIFSTAIDNVQSVRVFMDLTYYRYKFSDKLNQFYQFVPVRTIICGNMGRDAYVKKLLHNFSEQNGAYIIYKNDFWFLFKD